MKIRRRAKAKTRLQMAVAVAIKNGIVHRVNGHLATGYRFEKKPSKPNLRHGMTHAEVEAMLPISFSKGRKAR